MRKPLAASLLVVLALFLTGSVRGDDSVHDATYEELRLFDEAVAIIHDQYVEEIPINRLLDDAVVGTLLGIDPDAAFLKPDTYRELESQAPATRPGGGLALTRRGDAVTVVTAVEGSPAERAGLRPGDRVLKIDGLPTDGLQLWQADERVRGAAGSTVTLSVWRDGWAEPRDLTLTREEPRDPSLRTRDLADGIFYLRVPRFRAETPRELAAALDKLGAAPPTGIVLDLRNDPGGALPAAVELAGTFLGGGQLVVAMESRVAARRERFPAQAARSYRDAPMAVLVNAGTASVAEVVAGALQDWRRAVIVGTHTFGKGGRQSVFPLSDGSALRLTTARYVTPNGHPIDGKGITPDIVIEAPAAAGPPADLRADVQLQRALEIVKAVHVYRDHEAAGAGAH